MKKILSSALLCASFVLLSPSVQAYRYVDQADIPEWAESSIEKVRTKRIMTGGVDGRFSPKSELTRAQAVTLLSRLESHTEGFKEEVFDGELPFLDVNTSDWFYDSVQNAYHKGWTKGRTETTFDPAGKLTRAEWAVMVMRAFNLEDEVTEKVEFRDVPSRIWFSKAVEVSAHNEFIRFPNTNYYRPEKLVTRADAAWLMAKILDMPRLMGTSQESRFATRNPRGVDRNRVAVKPRNFNPNKQSVNVEKKGLNLVITPEEEVTVTSEPDYYKMGSFEVENTSDHYATLENVQFRLRFENPAIGPEEYFQAKMVEVGTTNEWTAQMNKSGEVVFVGMKKTLDKQEVVDFEVYLGPVEGAAFFQKSGKGSFYLFQAGGLVSRVFNKSGRSAQRYAPINIKDRNFADVYFDPTK